MTTTWNSFADGDVLPQLVKTPGLDQLVKFAAGSGDFNPLHYDYESLQAKQIGTIIVHGRFKYAMLGQLVSDWLGHNGRIKKIVCQYRGMDLPARPMTASGRVSAKWEQDGERLAEIEIWIENAEGKKTTPGTAIVAFD
jgi:acyl dehydratase